MKNKIFKSPVLPYTFRGKILVMIIRTLYRMVSIFKKNKWATPLRDFEENPINMSKKLEHFLFFGYKYYFKPPLDYPDELFHYFQNQDLDFSASPDFEVTNTLTLSAGGDLMPYEWIQKESTKYLWDDLGAYFFGADIVFANLETPIVSHKPTSLVPEVMLNDMHFNGSEEMYNIFAGYPDYKGYDVLSTANNHSWDMGEEGVLETISFLENKGIAFVGTARSVEEKKPLIIESNGIKIAFINYTFSLNQFELPKEKNYMVNHLRLNIANVDLTPIREEVASAKAKGVDIVIFVPHAGNAYQPLPSKETIDVYHRVFEECGADIILGTHPHNPQPMEKYSFMCPFDKRDKKGFVIYSLSDFIAYDIFLWGHLAPLLKLKIQKGLLNGKPHTQLVEVEVKPAYCWGNKDISKGKDLRLLDFEKLLNDISVGNSPKYLTNKCLKEIRSLEYFWYNYIASNSKK